MIATLGGYQMKTVLECIKDRRTFYSINNDFVIEDEKLESIVKEVAKDVPSAFNMQSQRVILLLGDEHHKLWNIVLETLRKIVPAESFYKTEDKIKNTFDAGHATILYFEDMDVVEQVSLQVPSFKENFKSWSIQGSAMMQYALWVALEAEGYGLSLQHYNPIIDDEVKATWNLPASWKLIAQMPVGKPVEMPEDKAYMSIDEKVIVFK